MAQSIEILTFKVAAIGQLTGEQMASEAVQDEVCDAVWRALTEAGYDVHATFYTTEFKEVKVNRGDAEA